MGTGWPNREKWLGLWRGVRNDRWTYARWFDQHDKLLLFDLDSDSDEMINLSHDPGYKKVLNEMEELLQTWLKRTNDPFDTGKRLPITNMLDIGQAFTTSSWLSKVHPEYANSIKNNFADFKTGEQAYDLKPIFK